MSIGTKLGWLGTLLVAATAVGGVGSGCEPEASEATYLTLHGEGDVLPGFSYSTGLVPEGASVQASFELAASGTAVLEAKGQPSGSESEPELTAVRGTGLLQVSGGFSMVGTLKIDIDGLPSYDGPIPGIENVAIEFGGEASFDPWSLDEAQTATAAIPPSKLPGIPLPGGIPGTLVLEVAEGSHVDVTFTPSCAVIDGKKASYEGQLARAGSLVIAPSIEIEVPFIGPQTFEIPSFTVDLALGAEAIVASGNVSEFGASIDGEKAKVGTCSGGEGGGGGQEGGENGGGNDAGGGAQGGAGAGGGCPYAVSFGKGQEELTACVNESCCLELGVCTNEGADLDSCNACLSTPTGGLLCDNLINCMSTECGVGFPVCDSGYLVGQQACGTCLGNDPSCCQAFTDCKEDPDCSTCLATGEPTACEASPLVPTIGACLTSCGC